MVVIRAHHGLPNIFVGKFQFKLPVLQFIHIAHRESSALNGLRSEQGKHYRNKYLAGLVKAEAMQPVHVTMGILRYYFYRILECNN